MPVGFQVLLGRKITYKVNLENQWNPYLRLRKVMRSILACEIKVKSLEINMNISHKGLEISREE